jgi:hypothetical protein
MPGLGKRMAAVQKVLDTDTQDATKELILDTGNASGSLNQSSNLSGALAPVWKHKQPCTGTVAWSCSIVHPLNFFGRKKTSQELKDLADKKCSHPECQQCRGRIISDRYLISAGVPCCSREINGKVVYKVAACRNSNWKEPAKEQAMDQKVKAVQKEVQTETITEAGDGQHNDAVDVDTENLEKDDTENLEEDDEQEAEDGQHDDLVDEDPENLDPETEDEVASDENSEFADESSGDLHVEEVETNLAGDEQETEVETNLADESPEPVTDAPTITDAPTTTDAPATTDAPTTTEAPTTTTTTPCPAMTNWNEKGLERCRDTSGQEVDPKCCKALIKAEQDQATAEWMCFQLGGDPYKLQGKAKQQSGMHKCKNKASKGERHTKTVFKAFKRGNKGIEGSFPLGYKCQRGYMCDTHTQRKKVAFTQLIGPVEKLEECNNYKVLKGVSAKAMCMAVKV